MPKLKLIIPLFLFLLLTAVQSAWAVTEFISTIGEDGSPGTYDYSSLSSWNSNVACDLTAAGTKVFTGSTTSGTASNFDSETVTLYRGGVPQSSITATVAHDNGSMILVYGISNPAFSFAIGDIWEDGNGNNFTVTSTGDSAIVTAKISGTWTSSDSGSVTIGSPYPWATSATNYIRIYTVGSSMNQGKWITGTTSTPGPYSLVVTAGSSNTSALNIGVNYVNISGLQIGVVNSTGTGVTNVNAVKIEALSGSANITLQKNIISGTISGSGNTGGGINSADNDSSAVINLYNNIVYGFVNGSAGFGISVGGSSGGNYKVYNNTCYSNYQGIVRVAGTANLANNLCISNTGGDYSGTFNTTEDDYSDDNTSPDTADRSKIVSFMSAGSGDFHLATTDASGAATAGAVLSAFPDDVQGINRGTSSWSVGASQYGDIWTYGGSGSGIYSSPWANPANWSTGVVPGSGTAVIFESPYNYSCTIPSGTVQLGSISISSGYTQTVQAPATTLALSGFSQAGGTFQAVNMNVSGDWNYSGGTFITGSGTVTFSGSAAQVINISGVVQNFNNLKVSNTSGGLTIGDTGTLALTGSLTINSGATLTADTSTNINVAGNWTNNSTSSAFTPGIGTVTLNGTGQTISGSSTFYNLTKTVTTADTLYFGTANSTQTINGTLTLSGASGSPNQYLVLRSGTPSAPTPGTPYNITVSSTSGTGASSVSYVDVQDSNASGGNVIPASYSVDSGDNTYWMFGSGVINSVKVWTGALGTAWGTPGNWSVNGTACNGTNCTYPGVNDGVLIDSANYNTNVPVISGTSQITIASLIMSGTANLTHAANSASEANKINLSITGNFNLGPNAAIDVTGDGYSATNGPGYNSNYAGSGSYGGLGGVEYGLGSTGYAGNLIGLPNQTYGSITAPVNLGSGSCGTSGGGAVILNISGVFTDNGTISANGYGYGSPSNTDSCGGAASGGSVFITTGTISGAGAISANGGGVNSYGTGGGGGRIAIILTSLGATFPALFPTPTAYGTNSWDPGTAGTIYEQTGAQTAGKGTLIIDNNGVLANPANVNNISGYRITTLMPHAQTSNGDGTYTSAVNLNSFSNIIIKNDGNLGLNSDTTITFGTANINIDSTGGPAAAAFITLNAYTTTPILTTVNPAYVSFNSPYTMNNYTLNIDAPLTIGTVSSPISLTISGTGALSHSTNFTTAMGEVYKLNLTVNGSLTLDSGVSIDADGEGYRSGANTGNFGNGPGSINIGGGGGSYGGMGGSPNGNGPTYGSITAPVDIGSSNSGGLGNAGGAVILNITGTLINNGAISANGQAAVGGMTSGTGGSVYITTGTMSGSGTISANGVNYAGGGRIAIISSDSSASSYPGSVNAYSLGNGTNYGAAGTIYEQAAGIGNLIINNNGHGSNVTDISSTTSPTSPIGSMTLQNNGNLAIDGGTGATASAAESGGVVTSVTVTSSGSGYNAGSYLVTFSGGNPTSPAVAVAQTTSGSISSITLLYGGAGYLSAPTVTIGGAGSLTAQGTVTINSNSTLTNNGTFSATGGWNQTGGIFNGGTTIGGTFYPGTTNFTGGISASPFSITGLNIGSGTVTFNPGYYSMNTGTSPDAITVASGAAINFGNTTTSSYANMVTLRSSSPGSSSSNYWYLANPSGSTVTANYVDVQDSYATNATNPVAPTNSINSNYNTNWTFPSTTVTWKGTTSNSWSNGANWSGGQVPGSGSTVSFLGGAYNNPCNFDESASTTVAAITVDSSYSSAISMTGSYPLTVTGNMTMPSGTFNLGSGTLNIGGSASFTGGTLNPGTGTLNINGSSASFAGVTLNPGTGWTLAFSGGSSPSWNMGGQTYYNVTVGAPSSGNYILSGTAGTISNKLTLNTASTINYGAINLTGTGTGSNSALVLDNIGAGSTTVINMAGSGAQNINLVGGTMPPLTINSGSNTTISGTTTLQAVTDNGTLNFSPGNYTITAGDTIKVNTGDTLNFTGGSYSNLVYLASSIPQPNLSNPGNSNDQWGLNNLGSVNASYTSVEDSDAASSIPASSVVNCINAGDNNNWNFNAAALNSWSLNMTTRQLTLNFSGGVNVSTFNVGQLKLSNASGSTSYTLTTSASSSPNGNTVVINLSQTDFNAISDTSGLFDSQSDSYITTSNTPNAFIKDLGGNIVSAVTLMNAAAYTQNTNTAANFGITASGARTTTTTAGTPITGVVIKTYDSNGYRVINSPTGNANLVFSAAPYEAIGTYTDQVRVDSGTGISFGSNTAVSFTNGMSNSSISLTLYYASSTTTTVNVVDSALNINALTNELSVTTVSPAAEYQLAFTTPQPSSSAIINTAFSTQPTVVMEDQYGNQTPSSDQITFYSSATTGSYSSTPGALTGTTVYSLGGGSSITTSGLAYNATGQIYLEASDTSSGTLAQNVNSAYSNNSITVAYARNSTVTPSSAPVSNFNLIPVNDNPAHAFSVLNFMVNNDPTGADGESLKIDQIKIAVGGTGGNAQYDIAGASLYKGTGSTLSSQTPVAQSAASITDNFIIFGTTGLDSIADNGSTEYWVYIYMTPNPLAAYNGQTYTFGTNEQGIIVHADGNQMAPSNPSEPAVVTGTIAVGMTTFDIISSASWPGTGTTGWQNSQNSWSNNMTVTAGQGASPPPAAAQITVIATDANKNIATSYGNTTHGQNEKVTFSGLNSIGSNNPKIDNNLLNTLLTVQFTNGFATVPVVAYQSVTPASPNIYVQDTTDSAFGCSVGSPCSTTWPFSLTVNPASASTLAVLSGTPQTAVIDNPPPSPLVCSVSDTYGNPVSGQSVNFAVTGFPTGATGYSVNPASASTGNDGLASTQLTIGNLGGATPYVVQASSSLNGTPLNYSPVSFDVTGIQPASLNEVSGSGQSGTVGAVLLSSPFVVELEAANGNPIQGQPVTFNITSSPSGFGTTDGATLSTASVNTDSSGLASTTLTLGNISGTYTVQAKYTFPGGVSSPLVVNLTATATASVPSQVVLSGPSSGSAGTPAGPFTLILEDSNNNQSSFGASTTFVLSTNNSGGTDTFCSNSTCSHQTGSPGSVTFSSGQSTATFYYEQSNATATSINLNASGGGLTSKSLPVSFLPGNVSYFVVTTGTPATQSTSTTAGTPVPVTITAYDSNNNQVTDDNTPTPLAFSGANSSIDPSPSGTAPTAVDSSGNAVAFSTSTAPTTTTLIFSGGVATTNIKLYKAETAHIVVTSGSVTTSSANSLSVTVANAAADHLDFQGSLSPPSPQTGFTAGTPFNFVTATGASVTLAVVDLYGNLCGSYGGNDFVALSLSGQANGPVSGTDSFISGSSSGPMTAQVNFTSGISTTALSATLYRAQSTALIATDKSLTGISMPSSSITVNAALMSQMVFQKVPTLMYAPSLFSPQPVVALADKYGNACPTQGAYISLTASSSSSCNASSALNGTLMGSNLTNNPTSSGVASFLNVSYTYPESIYLCASASAEPGVTPNGESLPPFIYAYITGSTAPELTLTQPNPAGESATISSVVNTQAQAQQYAQQYGNALSFIIKNGNDGFPGKISRIVIGRDTTHDTSGGWTSYLQGAYISDGVTQISGTIADNAITFGPGTSMIYSVSPGSSKTFNLTLALKSSLPAGACDKILAFTMSPGTDITLLGPESNTFYLTYNNPNIPNLAVVGNSVTIQVIAAKLVVSGNVSSMNAGTAQPITITAEDANNNIDWDYNYNYSNTSSNSMGIIFSGASPSPSPSNTSPTCTDYTGAPWSFGTATNVQFTNGVSSSPINMTLYDAGSVSIMATDANGLKALTSADELSLMVNGGAGTQLSWNTQPKSMVVANAPWNPFIVAVVDAYGNTASNNSPISISPSSGVSLTAGASNLATSLSGLATFSNFAVNSSNGVYPVYPLTLTASSPGLSPTAASIPITLVQNYTVNLTLDDSMTSEALTGYQLQAMDANDNPLTGPYSSYSTAFVPGSYPASLSLPYGTYTFNFTLATYVNLSATQTANVAAACATSTCGNVINWTEDMTSIAEANANYLINSNFAYNETTQTLSIRMWLTRLGKMVVDNGINNLGTASITVVDPFGNTLPTINIPEANEAQNSGYYTVTIPNVLSASNILGEALTPGATYYANLVINYGGAYPVASTATGSTGTFQNGTQFTLSVTETLVNNVINAIGENAAGVPAGQTVQSQIQGAQTSITQAITAAQASIKSDTAQILTATQTTIPAEIIAAQTTETNILEAKVLNSETAVATGTTLTIRYRTAAGLSPKIDVYDPKNVLRVSKATMQEIGATGIYSYPLLFQAGWGIGDFTIVCSEKTKGTVDSYTVTVMNTDLEQVNNNVSAVLGTTSGLNNISQAAAGLTSQIGVIESALNQLSSGAAAGNRAQQTSTSSSMEALFTQMQGVSNQIQKLSTNQGLNLEKLYTVAPSKQKDMEYLKNKTQELKAAVEISKNMIDNIANKPVVQEVYEYSK